MSLKNRLATKTAANVKKETTIIRPATLPPASQSLSAVSIAAVDAIRLKIEAVFSALNGQNDRLINIEKNQKATMDRLEKLLSYQVNDESSKTLNQVVSLLSDMAGKTIKPAAIIAPVAVTSGKKIETAKEGEKSLFARFQESYDKVSFEDFQKFLSGMNWADISTSVNRVWMDSGRKICGPKSLQPIKDAFTSIHSGTGKGKETPPENKTELQFTKKQERTIDRFCEDLGQDKKPIDKETLLLIINDCVTSEEVNKDEILEFFLDEVKNFDDNAETEFDSFIEFLETLV